MICDRSYASRVVQKTNDDDVALLRKVWNCDRKSRAGRALHLYVVKMPFREDEVIYASYLQNQHSLLNGKTASILLFKERGVWAEVEKSEVAPPPSKMAVAMAERVITTEMRAHVRVPPWTSCDIHSSVCPCTVRLLSIFFAHADAGLQQPHPTLTLLYPSANEDA